MVRPLRVEYPHALYHVMVRGNAKQKIFRDNDDRERFLACFGHQLNTNNVVCHAYCLMDNHFHLLLETPEANLSTFMRNLDSVSAQSFNQKYKRTGHVFQGRYKAYLIEKESYLLEVARYIVLNPVHAHIVAHPRDWVWSSYGRTAGFKKAEAWLSIKDLLQYFSKAPKEARFAYRKFIEDGIQGRNPFDDLVHDLILGTPQFVSRIWEESAHGLEEVKEFARDQRIIGRPTLEEIFAEVATKKQREDAIVFAVLRCGYQTSEIAKVLKLDRSTIGKIFRRTQK